MKRNSVLLVGALLVGSSISARADEWPQWRGPERNGVWNESGLVQRFDAAVIPRKWTVPIASGYSGPTVSDGRVYVMDRLVEPKQLERVHCVDWETGEPIWTHVYDCAYEGISYEAGPRASVLVHQGRAYSLGSMGHLFCLNVEDGAVLWERNLYREYDIQMPDWGIASSPLIEGDLLIVQLGGKNGCVAAFDKRSGSEVWLAVDDAASYSAPIMVQQAARRVLVCWTGNQINGLDPATGGQHWKFAFKSEKWPIGIATPVVQGDLLLISEAHKGTLLLRLSQDELAVEPLWHRRKEEVEAALHCLISTPFVDGDYIYGADNSGILRCLKLSTGEQVWEDRTAVPENRWATIHLIPNGDRTWLFNERGELILAELTPAGFKEISRAKLLDPTTDQLRRRDGVTWSHPAFAYQHVFARNDKELVCADLAAP